MKEKLKSIDTLDNDTHTRHANGRRKRREKKIQNGKLDETMSCEREIVRRFAQERQIEHEALKVPSRKSKRDV